MSLAVMRVRRWRPVLEREWLLVLSLGAWLVSSVYVGHFPGYSTNEFQVLFILFVLFVVTTGLKNSGVFDSVARRVERGRYVALKMVLLTFLLSMWVTNDVALLIVVPLTVRLRVRNKAWLVALETLAANVGSALTPFGNPQNLFIYWLYGVTPGAFVESIAPFVGGALVFLVVAALLLKMPPAAEKAEGQAWNPQGTVYMVLLVLFVLVSLHLLPLYAGLLPILYVLLFDRPSLDVDYGLLATFFCLFGLTDNLSQVFAAQLHRTDHVFLTAVILSQVLSNVPTTLILVHHVSRWQVLLWGVNVGGFGTLIASLANVIAYRMYATEADDGAWAFLSKFSLLSGGFLVLGVVLYYVVGPGRGGIHLQEFFRICLAGLQVLSLP